MHPPMYHKRHWEDSEFDLSGLDWMVVAVLCALAWSVYWLIIHWVDHWVGDWLAWYVELLSPVLALPVIWLRVRYGLNPLHWWPMVWGHSVRLEPLNADLVLMDEAAVIELMGGPTRVWCDVRDLGEVHLKFRRKRDAVWFALFPVFRSKKKRKF